MHKTIYLVWISIFTLVIVMGCSDMGSDPVSTGSEDPKKPVSFSADIDPIFAANSCAGCHGGSGGLVLTSHTDLMTGGNSGVVVISGDADNSILYKKISGDTAGERMPLGGSKLDQELIDKIKDWINEGALDN